jgi:hypothetical protein
MTAAPIAMERHDRMMRIRNSERWAIMDIGSEPLTAVLEKRQAIICPL